MKENTEQRKAPKQERSSQTIGYIVEATAQLLSKEPFSKITTNKIVQRAGVSIGSLYQYFPNKESILLKSVEREFNGKVDRFVDYIRQYDLAKESLDTFFEGIVDLYIELYTVDGKLHRNMLKANLSFKHFEFIFENDQRIIDALVNKLESVVTAEKSLVEKRAFFLLYNFKGALIGALTSPFEHRIKDFREELLCAIKAQFAQLRK